MTKKNLKYNSSINLLKITFLTGYLFLTINLFAQNKEQAKFETLIRLADKQFELDYYRNAIDFYLRAYNIDSNDVRLNYNLAECYRQLFDYKNAQKHYSKIPLNEARNYPLAFFYNALMCKNEGEYEKAITLFEQFISLTKNIEPEYFRDKKQFFERTLIEMEGAYWAIEQLFEYKVTLLPTPVNSVFNDFSTTILNSDSNLLIVSGRKDSKLDNKNALGESFTNIYKFGRLKNTWYEADFDDNFDIVNSKYNEGSGIFNSTGTKYYFTSCGRTDSYCKIYVTEKKNGKWHEPVLLNENINSANSDNKQPVLSKNGDTLYFVSNRNGGYGQNDIWYSVKKTDNEDWGIAINPGYEINTPFNEISPFFYSLENLLFFSSDGHKGFGGLDIFMAKKDSVGNYVITNLSKPFNTNADDCYFTLGENFGYLTSNRKNGVGEFDIYQFNNLFIRSKNTDYQKKLADLSNELSKLKYTVEIEQPIIPEEIVPKDLSNIYDRILSAKHAALCYNVTLVFFEPDYFDFETLSIDDKSIIDMMYMAAEVNFTKQKADSVYSVDKLIFENIPEDEKNRIIRFANLYLTTSGGAAAVKLNPDDKQWYSSVSLDQKQQFDRLVAFCIQKLKAEQNRQDILKNDIFGFNQMADSSLALNKLTPEEYEKLISVKLAGLIYSVNFKFFEPDMQKYQQLTADEESLFEMDYKSRAFEITPEILDSLQREDRFVYNQLSFNEQNKITSLANCLINAPADSVSVYLTDTLNLYYKNLDLNKKRRTDRLIAYRVKQKQFDEKLYQSKNIKDILPDIDTVIVNKLKQDDYQKILSVLMAEYYYKIHFPFLQPDKDLYSTFTIDDKGLTETLYRLQIKETGAEIIDYVKTEDKINYGKITEAEKLFIDKIALQISKSNPDSSWLETDEADNTYYRNLTLDQKRKADRLIAYKVNQISEIQKQALVKYSDILKDEFSVLEPNETGILFTDIELKNIERILSYKLACFEYNMNQPFLSPDYYLFSQMSLENLSIADLLFASKTFMFKDPSVLEAIQQADEKEYLLLNKSLKNFVDGISEQLLLAEKNEKYLRLTAGDSTFYSNLAIEDKYRTDRLIMYRLRTLLYPKPTLKNTEEYFTTDLLSVKELGLQNKIISYTDYNNYERLLSVRIAAEIYKIPVVYTEHDNQIFKNSSIDDLSIMDLMFKIKAIRLQDSLIIDSLREQDKIRYSKLSLQKQQYIQRVSDLYFAQLNTLFQIHLQASDSALYANQDIKEKYQTDRFIAMFVQQTIAAQKITKKLADNIKTDELNLSELSKPDLISETELENYNRLLSVMLAQYIYGIKLPFTESDFQLNSKLSIDDRSILDMMYMLKVFSLKDSITTDSVKLADKMYFAELSDKTLVQEIVKQYTTSDLTNNFVVLPDEVNNRYANLSIDEKYETDRFVYMNLCEIINNKNQITEIEEKIKTDQFSESVKAISDSSGIISDDLYAGYEKIISFKLANYIHNIRLPFLPSDKFIYKNFTIDDRSLVEMMFEMRLPALTDSASTEILQKSDSLEYQTIDPDLKDWMERVCESWESTKSFVLSNQDSSWYANLTITEKLKTDRLLSFIISSKIKALQNKNQLTNNIAIVQNGRTIDFGLNLVFANCKNVAVTGRILNSENSAVENFVITTKQNNLKTTTNQAGQFYFKDLVANQYYNLQIQLPENAKGYYFVSEIKQECVQAENKLIRDTVKIKEYVNITENNELGIHPVENIYFMLNSAELEPSDKNMLNNISNYILKNNFKVILNAYTDNTGTIEYNTILCKRRSDAVKNYLISRGVKTENISVHDFVTNHPIAPNNSETGRTLNRRVEVVILKN